MMYSKVNMKCNFYGIKKMYKIYKHSPLCIFVNVQLLVGYLFLGVAFLNRSVKSIILEKMHFLCTETMDRKTMLPYFCLSLKNCYMKGKCPLNITTNSIDFFFLFLSIDKFLFCFETIVQFFISLFFFTKFFCAKIIIILC